MGGNPDQARQLVTRYLQREKVDFFTGPIGSNVALAVGPALFAAKVPYLSNNPAPASSPAPSAIRTGSAPRTRTTPSTRPPARSRPTAASRRCSSWPRLSGGQGRAQRLQARLQGRPGDEVYTKLGQIDYAAELAQIRAAKPDAVYIFLPGGMGINFVKQFVSAGLSQSIKLIGPLLGR